MYVEFSNLDARRSDGDPIDASTISLVSPTLACLGLHISHLSSNLRPNYRPRSRSRSLESQQPTASDMRSSDASAPTNLDLLDIILLISQVRFHLLHSRTLPKINADREFLVSRVQDHDDVGAVFVQVCGAVKGVVADSNAVGVWANEAGVVRERPCALGDFVLAVLDQDELFVVVVVCRAVLDDEPPVRVFPISGSFLVGTAGDSIVGRLTNSSRSHYRSSGLCARCKPIATHRLC